MFRFWKLVVEEGGGRYGNAAPPTLGVGGAWVQPRPNVAFQDTDEGRAVWGRGCLGLIFCPASKKCTEKCAFWKKKSEKKMFRKVKNRENAKVDQKNRKNGTKFTELWGKCQWFFFCGGAAASKMERFLGQPPAEGQVVLADHHKGHPGEEQRGMGRGRVVQILQVVWGLGDFSRTPRGGGGSSW